SAPRVGHRPRAAEPVLEARLQGPGMGGRGPASLVDTGAGRGDDRAGLGRTPGLVARTRGHLPPGRGDAPLGRVGPARGLCGYSRLATLAYPTGSPGGERTGWGGAGVALRAGHRGAAAGRAGRRRYNPWPARRGGGAG